MKNPWGEIMKNPCVKKDDKQTQCARCGKIIHIYEHFWLTKYEVMLCDECYKILIGEPH